MQVKCIDCEAGKGPKNLTKVIAWGHYTGAWKDFIWSLKFKAQPFLMKEIAVPFIEWVVNELPLVDGVVPVPMYAARLAERGFNQAEVIASLLHGELGLPLLTSLERIRMTPSQVQLSRWERLKNLENAFRVSNPALLKGKSVCLVDDVTTTGATLEACAQAMLESGAQKVYALCLAAGLENVKV